MKALIADDSLVFRKQIKTALAESNLCADIVTVKNGREALEAWQKTAFELIILDLEMPEMTGLETLRAAQTEGLTSQVVVFASWTARGADATVQALDLGACDFITKPSNVTSLEQALSTIKSELIPKVKALMNRQEAARIARRDPHHQRPHSPQSRGRYFEANPRWHYADIQRLNPQVLVIASSTGGPPILRTLLTNLGPSPRIPIVIVQHMPPMFTTSLASTLGRLSGIPATEAKDGQVLKAGTITVAPGDFHLSLDKEGDTVVCELRQTEKRNSVRPAADYLFESASTIYGAGTLGIVLTGMGYDGLYGAKAIKDHGGAVIIQDEESSAVWGMPGTVYLHKCFDAMLAPDQINELIAKLAKGYAA
jgi:two-component system chemotaxis response regulator CheB